jgi:N-acetylmuramic acid 6-phosphate etherase
MLSTEQRNPATAHLDQASTNEMLRLIQDANRRSVEAVDEALPQIARVVDAAASAIAAGGRIIYVGAGTSGRLAMQDAAECPPTYGVDPETVVAIMAGGRDAVFRAVEGVEDDAEAGSRDMLAFKPGPHDLVLGISASGGAPYVAAALRTAREHGAVTASLSSNPGTAIEREADLPSVTDTGPEVVTGSTRMKAGNAQKMVLNMISTCAMVKTGKVRGNLMINLRPTNRKLRARMIRIVREELGVGEARAVALLDAHDWALRPTLDSVTSHNT